MKWFENGIQFEGTADEFLSIHQNSSIANVREIELTSSDQKRTRTGRKVGVKSPNGEIKNFRSILDASEFLRRSGIVIPPDKISHEIIKAGVCSVGGYEIRRVEEKKAEELNLTGENNHE